MTERNTIIRFPSERVVSPGGEYYCSGHSKCRGPHLPMDHDLYCDLGPTCDDHWKPCEFCVAVEIKQ